MTTQRELLLEFFQQNLNRDIAQDEIYDWAMAEWEKRTGKRFRQIGSAVRSLYQTGYLARVKRGVYRYTPHAIKKPRPKYFSTSQRQKIFARDNHACRICGFGEKHGMELHIGYMRFSKENWEAKTGKGLTLCSYHYKAFRDSLDMLKKMKKPD